ncbi:lipase family protein, partial [Corynebacterium pseudodiphtheriticum]
IHTNADGLPYLSVNANYELPLQYLANLAGIRIISTDYMGMGTPDHHTYVNSVEEAHAVLDAARAGLQAAGAPADSPVGFAGYSQGGGAAAAAAEHKASYAPELNLVGTFAGAPPADLRHVLEAVDNSSIVAALGYTLNGFVDRHPALQRIIDEEFNEEGKRFLHDAEISCIGDATINWGFTDTRTLTKSGDSFSEVINRHPELSNLVEAQRLGTQPVSGPIMVSNSGDDDLIPLVQATTMARQYCAQGGQVQFLHTDVPPVLPELKAGINHALPLFTDMPQGLQYLIDRFHGIAPRNDCGTF